MRAAGTRYRFRIDGGRRVPDPASRCNPTDVHGPSEVIDPHAYDWARRRWRGRPWHEAVVYELHVGPSRPRAPSRGRATACRYLAGAGHHAPSS